MEDGSIPRINSKFPKPDCAGGEKRDWELPSDKGRDKSFSASTP